MGILNIKIKTNLLENFRHNQRLYGKTQTYCSLYYCIDKRLKYTLCYDGYLNASHFIEYFNNDVFKYNFH